MIIRFEGMESCLFIRKGIASSIVVENKVLLARICQSFISNLGQQAIEPYGVWDDEGRSVKPRDFFTVVVDPFNLPWDKRVFVNKFQDKIEGLLLENDEMRYALEELNELVRSHVAELGLQMQSDYAFGTEWDLRRYLKAFGYGVDFSLDESLFDNLMRFLAYVADMAYEGVLVFVNLSIFLPEKQLKEVMERGVFLDLKMIFIDYARTAFFPDIEDKYVIDQDLLEC